MIKNANVDRVYSPFDAQLNSVINRLDVFKSYVLYEYQTVYMCSMFLRFAVKYIIKRIRLESIISLVVYTFFHVSSSPHTVYSAQSCGFSVVLACVPVDSCNFFFFFVFFWIGIQNFNLYI